ncbi:MAG: class A beta-lactamase-related serine hydrolase [Elusimicrobia bacterium]|nr:class A beta-lactamase-related serine hydrolase [Elusimicrobiota bacterium]
MPQNKPLENNSCRRYWFAIPVFIAGMCAGYFLEDIWPGAGSVLSESTEVRQEGYKFINPLLECENSSARISVLIRSFRKDLLALVALHSKRGDISDTSIYFRDLNSGPWYGYKEQDKFRPASLLKIPIAMSFYKAAEDNPGILKKQIRFTVERPMPPDRVQTITPKRKIELGKEYTVEQLIEAMIRYSDNQALFLLYGSIPDSYLFDLYKALGVENDVIEKFDGELSVKSFATFYRILFNASYLDRAHSEQLLFFLSESEYENALVAGLPDGVLAAHKFGEGGTLSAERQLEDCGIVYYPGRPYLLCVMAKGRKLSNLEKYIKAISSLVYGSINSSMRKK